MRFVRRFLSVAAGRFVFCLLRDGVEFRQAGTGQLALSAPALLPYGIDDAVREKTVLYATGERAQLMMAHTTSSRPKNRKERACRVAD